MTCLGTGGIISPRQRHLMAIEKFVQIQWIVSSRKREHDGLSVSGAYGSELPPINLIWV